MKRWTSSASPASSRPRSMKWRMWRKRCSARASPSRCSSAGAPPSPCPPPAPRKPGITVFEDYALDELTRYIDWTPFFITWEMKGRYPAILKDEKTGTEATKLFNDAQALLKRIIQEKLFTAKGVVGLFPAKDRKSVV